MWYSLFIRSHVYWKQVWLEKSSSIDWSQRQSITLESNRNWKLKYKTIERHLLINPQSKCFVFDRFSYSRFMYLCVCTIFSKQIKLKATNRKIKDNIWLHSSVLFCFCIDSCVSWTFSWNRMIIKYRMVLNWNHLINIISSYFTLDINLNYSTITISRLWFLQQKQKFIWFQIVFLKFFFSTLNSRFILQTIRYMLKHSFDQMLALKHSQNNCFYL